MSKLEKLIDILDKIEYILLGCSSAAISFYILLLFWIWLSRRYRWINSNKIAWTLIIGSFVLSLIVGYVVWRKISQQSTWSWSNSKINIALYHFNKRGQFILFLFLWMLAITVIFNAFQIKNTNFIKITSGNLIIENGKNILTVLLGILTVFNMGNIPIYNLSIGEEISLLKKDTIQKKNKFQIKIWATNTGSANAAYRFIGLYNVKDINKIYVKKENWVLTNDILKICPIMINKTNCNRINYNFENLEPGFATNIQTITLSLPEKVNELYVIYVSSINKVIKKKIDLK